MRSPPWALPLEMLKPDRHKQGPVLGGDFSRSQGCVWIFQLQTPWRLQHLKPASRGVSKAVNTKCLGH